MRKKRHLAIKSSMMMQTRGNDCSEYPAPEALRREGVVAKSVCAAQKKQPIQVQHAFKSKCLKQNENILLLRKFLQLWPM